MQVVYLSGSMYDMGFAQGTLLKDDIAALMPAQMAHFADLVASGDLGLTNDTIALINEVPMRCCMLVVQSSRARARGAQYGLDGALDLTANWTLPYATSGAVDELRGIADGSGVDLTLLKRVTFFPELAQAQCSLVAAFGPATPTGALLYTRALDWDVSGPLNDYALIAVYQPNDGTNTFTIVSWSGARARASAGVHMCMCVCGCVGSVAAQGLPAL